MVVSTEYALEVNNKDNIFVRQIEVFNDYEEALQYMEDRKDEIELADGEYLNIIYIDYDENGDEIGFGTVC